MSEVVEASTEVEGYDSKCRAPLQNSRAHKADLVNAEMNWPPSLSLSYIGKWTSRASGCEALQEIDGGNVSDVEFEP